MGKRPNPGPGSGWFYQPEYRLDIEPSHTPPPNPTPLPTVCTQVHTKLCLGISMFKTRLCGSLAIGGESSSVTSPKASEHQVSSQWVTLTREKCLQADTALALPQMSTNGRVIRGKRIPCGRIGVHQRRALANPLFRFFSSSPLLLLLFSGSHGSSELQGVLCSVQ